jgi:general secretion pathway protein D
MLYLRQVVFALLTTALTACTETTTTRGSVFGEDVSVARTSLFRSGAGAAFNDAGDLRRDFVQTGNDNFVNEQAVRDTREPKAIAVPVGDDLVEIALINASIDAAASAVLGKILTTKFLVDPDVTGSITMRTTGPIPKSALLELFEVALKNNGSKLVRKNKVLQIVPSESSTKNFQLAANGVGSEDDILVAQIKNVSVSQMARFLSPLVDEGLDLTPYRSKNLLLLSGSTPLLEAALEALNLFDTDVFEGKSIALVELKSVDPTDILDQLFGIFENEIEGDLEGLINFVPNSRLGSMLVVAHNKKLLSEAQKWIRQLDKAGDRSRRSIENYALQNRSAKEVAEILNALVSDAGDESAEPGYSVVTADPSRNSVLVKATQLEHREIRYILNSVDTVPSQVLLQATIAEVRLNDDLELGVRWYLDQANANVKFTESNTGARGAISPGFSATFSHGSIGATINALAEVTDVKVISSPTLMVLDNKEAILQIGDQVPIATESSTDPDNPDSSSVTQVQYRDTGVILKVQPTINQNRQVYLNVTQEVSSVTETVTSGINSPTIRQRRIATNVLLNDGMTLALGGLVQENEVKTVTKVPGLGDVPVVGGLFRRTESGKDRAELLVLIRPTVVSGSVEQSELTRTWRSRLAAANDLLDTGIGDVNHTLKDVFE